MRRFILMRFFALLIPACLLTSDGLAAPEAVVQLPKAEDSFFRCYTGSSTELIRFATNGTYVRFDREHMFVEQSDSGTWRQDTSGEIMLISKQCFKNVEAGPLSVWTADADRLAYLPTAREKLAEFLANNSRSKFSKEEIEAIERYGQENCLSRFEVDFEAKQVTRAQLKSLLTAIDRYLANLDKNHFSVKPMRYKGRVFLLWRDSETPVNRDLPGIKYRLDRAEPGETISFVFMQTDQATFDRESKLRQEFIFYPQLNEPPSGEKTNKAPAQETLPKAK